MKIKTPDVASDVLFRTLLATPRPKQALQFRLSGLPNVDLFVQAVGSHEIAYSGSNLIAYVLSKCLVLRNGRPAFSSPGKINELLSISEFRRLSQEALDVLAQISPMFSFVDYKEWNAKLDEGARHSSNFLLTHSLGMCFTLAVLPDKIVTQDHPELYFAIPRNQLLDCHWMAYWAARKVYKELVLGAGSDKDTIEDLKKITKGEKL